MERGLLIFFIIAIISVVSAYCSWHNYSPSAIIERINGSDIYFTVIFFDEDNKSSINSFEIVNRLS